MTKKSALEEKFLQQISDLQLPPMEREFRFHPTRRWRADFAFPDIKLLVEIEGGTWVQGAHVRGRHFSSDCEKYNAAGMLGWKVLRFTSDMIKSGLAYDTFINALSELW